VTIRKPAPSDDPAYEARYAAAMRVVALIRLAHDRHLATGDYITLGIAAQDALSEFDRAALSAREEQK
jgi:hypothetical protein